eukprot:5515940-Ditylum_brightwellii.AAC.1
MVLPVKRDRKEEEKANYSSTNDEGRDDDDVNGHDAASLRPHVITDNNQSDSGGFNNRIVGEKEKKGDKNGCQQATQRKRRFTGTVSLQKRKEIQTLKMKSKILDNQVLTLKKEEKKLSSRILILEKSCDDIKDNILSFDLKYTLEVNKNKALADNLKKKESKSVHVSRIKRSRDSLQVQVNDLNTNIQKLGAVKEDMAVMKIKNDELIHQQGYKE